MRKYQKKFTALSACRLEDRDVRNLNLPHTLLQNLFIKPLILPLIYRSIWTLSYCFIRENLGMWSQIPMLIANKMK